MYGHSEKDEPCVTGWDVEGEKTSNEVYDTALLMFGLFHIIEWFRTIMLLTVTCMGY